MVLDNDIIEYLEKLGRPISREDLKKEFEDKASPKVFGEALASVRKRIPTQVVRVRGRANATKMYFFPSSWAKEKEAEKIPRETAHGICLLSTKRQDIYPAACHELCPSFFSCTPYLKAYFENNGIEWPYGDKTEAKIGKLKRFLKRKTDYHPI